MAQTPAQPQEPPIRLSDALILRMMGTSKIRETFPVFADAQNRMRGQSPVAPDGKTCTPCQNRKNTQVVTDLRNLILGMNETQINTLKQLSGLAGRTLVTHTRENNKIIQKEI